MPIKLYLCICIGSFIPITDTRLHRKPTAPRSVNKVVDHSELLITIIMSTKPSVAKPAPGDRHSCTLWSRLTSAQPKMPDHRCVKWISAGMWISKSKNEHNAQPHTIMVRYRNHCWSTDPLSQHLLTDRLQSGSGHSKSIAVE